MAKSTNYGVPIIDMLDFEGLPEKLVKACEEWGCFRLVNHGVSATLMSKMKAVARALLDLPMETKMRNAHPIWGRGYTPPNVASPFFESLSVYDMALPGSLDGFCNELGATPHQREILVKYSKAVHDLVEDLGSKLVKGLGLAGGLFDGWPCQYRINKYNYGPETVGLTGVLMHSDPGFMTILQDDEVIGGLEVVDENTSELIPVHPIPGSLVVNVGDTARAWSNGRFCNVKHRVQCTAPTTRISIALFVLGPKEAKVETPPELVNAEHPRLYVPFDFEEYRELRNSTASPTGGALQLLLSTKS